MAEKRLWVRLALRGGKQVSDDLRRVGRTGDQSTRRFAQAVERANASLARFGRLARRAAGIATAAFTAVSTAAVRNSFQTIDAQAKMAASFDTTVESLQVLSRAAETAGVSQRDLEGSLRRFVRRVSLAERGTGAAADALERLGLSAADFEGMDLAERVLLVRERMQEMIPAAERAGVATQIFGDRSGLAFARIDADAIRDATAAVREYGVGVSQVDAAQIERTNDAISLLRLVGRGLANQIASAIAPALESMANALANAAREGGVLREAIQFLGENIQRIASYATAFVGLMAGRFVGAMGAAAIGIRGAATALLVLRGALIRTGIGALIVGAGELVYQFTRLVEGAGGFGEALGILGRLASQVWRRMMLGGRALFNVLSGVADAISAAFVRAFAWIGERWDRLVNGIRDPFNSMMEAAGIDARIGESQVGSRLSERADEIENRGREAIRFGGALLRSARSTPPAVRELRDALTGSQGDGKDALNRAGDAADRFRDSLENAGDEAENTGGASKRAGDAAAGAAQRARKGWAAVSDSLATYARDAGKWGQQLGQTFTSAFRGIENAIGQMVENGKASFGDLTRSILADLAKIAARRYILGPLASALGGLFSAAPATSPRPVARPVARSPSFAGGGYTGDGARTGGIDGRGGFPAILHPRESVIDHTRRGRREAPIVNVTIQTADVESFRQSRTQIAADLGRAVVMGQRGI